MMNEINELKLLFVGYDEFTKNVMEVITNDDNIIDIIGVIDLNESNKYEIKKNGIEVLDLDYLNQINETNKKIDVIFVTEEISNNSEIMNQLRAINTIILDNNSLELIKVFINVNQSLKKNVNESEKLKEELNAILNATGEAIQVVDKDGVIKYVNKAFTEVTKIPSDKRINYNILDFYDHGALADALKTHKPVFGKVLTTETNVVVICNASPTFVNGKFDGAVGVFRDITDIIKSVNQPEKSENNTSNNNDNIEYLKALEIGKIIIQSTLKKENIQSLTFLNLEQIDDVAKAKLLNNYYNIPEKIYDDLKKLSNRMILEMEEEKLVKD